MPDVQQSLAALRLEVDAIDDELAALLQRRLARTDAIGRLKAQVGEAPVDPQRQGRRREVLAAAAQRHALPPDLWAEIQRCISAEVIRRHQQARRPA